MFAAASYVRFLCQDSKVMDVPRMWFWDDLQVKVGIISPTVGLERNNALTKPPLVGGFNPLKNISQNGNLPQIGVKIKNIWNQHLEHLSPFKQYLILRIYLWSVFACKGDWRRESKHVIIALLLHTQTRFQEASGSRYPPSFRLLLRLLESLNWERSFFKKETSETESQQLQSNLYFHTKKKNNHQPSKHCQICQETKGK